MDAHAELEQLLAEQFDGSPDAARNGKIGDLLRTHPELQAEYLEQMQLHALLQWRGGKAIPQDRPTLESEKAQPALAGASRWRSRRSLAAVLLVTACSLAAFFHLQSPEAQATPDVVERLLDLNLDLLQAESRAERDRIYAGQEPDLKVMLRKASLPADDREFAQSLLETSSWLTKNTDPMAEAERFNDIADKVVVRMDAATNAKDEKRLVQLANTFYERLAEYGIDANLQRAFAAGNLEGDQKIKLEQTSVRHASRTKKFAEIIARSPEPSRKAIHRNLKSHPHKMKKLPKATE